jgi:polysaccharide export outer membrane protein
MPRMSRLVVALVTLLVAVAGCGHTKIKYDYSKDPDPRTLEYVIGVSDELNITVWKQPDLTTEASVRPDGTITMPLIGDIKAAGRTPTELKNEIQTRVGNFIKDPSAVVTVAVTAVNSYTYTVSGNVNGPGVFTATHYVTVSHAITEAGGPNKFAGHPMVLIRQDRKSGKIRRIPIDYEDVASGRRPEANLVLMPGDQLFVP